MIVSNPFPVHGGTMHSVVSALNALGPLLESSFLLKAAALPAVCA